MFHWMNFLTYVVITAITPGPNNIMSMSNAGRLGLKKSIPFNLGIWTGFSIVMLLCTLFCSLLSAVIPKVKMPMMVIGALYMFHLAWKTWRSDDKIEEYHAGSGYLAGLGLQFVNPKIYIYGIVSLESYILPHFGGEKEILMGFALLLAFIAFLCNLLWALCGTMFRLIFSRYARVTNGVMALLLVYCGVALFM